MRYLFNVTRINILLGNFSAWKSHESLNDDVNESACMFG